MKPKVHSFCKILTASDTSTHGGFSVLRKHANECLPLLDMSLSTPGQELVARDLHGYEWPFKHIFRGQPRRHLFTTGWSTFVTSKRLVAGDAFVFLRGENGELRVGVRKNSRQPSLMPSSVISSRNMHLGVLATASHALTAKTRFVVHYKPRTSQYIVGLNKYLEASKRVYVVGMRFTMRFEGDESPDRRFTGTIVGVGDISSHWPGSEWRSLKVQWDEPASIYRPDRVSAWEIKQYAMAASLNSTPPVTLKNKRPKHNDLSSSEGLSNPPALNFWSGRVFEQKDPNNLGHIPGQLSSPPPGEPQRLILEPSVDGAAALVRSVSSPFALHVDVQTNAPLTPSCRLFGIELRQSLDYPPSCTIVSPTSNMADSYPEPTVETDKGQNADSLNSLKRLHHAQKTYSVGSFRNRTKVQMQGLALGRSVDLSLLNGYMELVNELERLFDIEGELQPDNKWVIVFTDDEGDMMLVGDHPWGEFCQMVKKLHIYSREIVKKLRSQYSLPISSSIECEGLDSDPKSEGRS